MAARSVMEAHLAGLLESKLDLVVLDRTGATDPMMAYCADRSIEFKVIPPANLEAQLLDLQKLRRFDCMGLTFNRLIPQAVIDAFNGQIFNLHLAWLPMFPGFGATRRALNSGLTFGGVTVHFVDAGVDTGPIIAQQKVSIYPSDTEAILGRRQFEAAVPLVLQTVRLIEGKKQVRFDNADADLVRFAERYCREI
jgi:phosphoribosylglycinamide formyltransferase-1